MPEASESIGVAGLGRSAALPIRIGRYRVLRVLGEGGMGIVYAAFDDELARPVALKLVRGASSHASTSGRDRMRREAQAMAQLSHPNVVQIFDVGEQGGELFLTMELIRGQTLDAWLAELGPARAHAKRWREVVAMFVAAGRGLAAAHATGLVHRDFKPSNVLVGEGVVKVGDFGLARGELDVELAHADPEAPTEGSRKLAERMTETGALVGTPAYLAPEQIESRASSAASDQFSFCVALHEALVGQRPFAGDDFATFAANLLTGRRRSVAESTAVPGWLLAVIDRGLAREPGERWPSMDALLDALLDDPAKRRRRRLALGLATLTLVSIASALGIREVQHERQCEALAGVIDERWNDEAKQQLAEAFAATDAPDAAATWARVEPRIESWITAWREARREVCDDSRDEPEQARLAAACLEHQRWELEALLDVFAAADRMTVVEAVVAAAELPEVARCSDPVQLASDVSLVSDSLAQDESIALRRDLARVLALERAGRHADALALAETSLESARALGDQVLEAEALAKLGNIRWLMADFPGAEQSLLAGHMLAGRIEHDHVAYATARDLSWVVGVRLARPREGRVWWELARMNLARSGGDPEREPDLFERLGELEFAEGHHEAAREAHERALALRETAVGSEHPSVAEGVISLGSIEVELQDPRARETLERGRALAEAALGPAHPRLADADSHLGRALFELGRSDESVVALRRAIAIRESAFGPDDPALAYILVNLAAVLQVRRERGDLLESLLLLESAVEILERKLGPEHRDTLMTRSTLATTKADLEQVDEAIAMLRDTLVVADRTLEPDDPNLAIVLGNLGYYLVQQGDHAAGLLLWRRVATLDEARLGPEHVEVAQDLDWVARSELALGEFDRAFADATRVLSIRQAQLAPDDLSLAAGHDLLALVLLALERIDEAGEQHEQAQAIRVAAGEAGSPADLSELRAELARLSSPTR